MTARTVAVGWAMGGVAVTGMGAIAFAFFSPSPHGYGEIFIAWPIIVVGVGTAGGALALGRFPRAVRILGWLILAAAAVPVILALLFILSLALGLHW